MRAIKMKIRMISQYWYLKRITNEINEKDEKENLAKLNKIKTKIP